jgi:hypothetical protein
MINNTGVFMTKYILPIFILVTLIYSQERYDNVATINDQDKFTNVREEPAANSKIVTQLNMNDIFYYSPSHNFDGWYLIYFDVDTSYIPPKSRKEYLKHFKRICNLIKVTGYVFSSKVQPLYKLPKINFSHWNQKKATLELSNDSISFALVSDKYDSAHHTVTMFCNYTMIDGMRAWGIEGGIPHAKISSIKLIMLGKEILLPSGEYSNLFEPDFRTINFYLGKSQTIFIHMMNSDGGGAYDVVFIIENGKYKRKFINLNPYN